MTYRVEESTFELRLERGAVTQNVGILILRSCQRVCNWRHVNGQQGRRLCLIGPTLAPVSGPERVWAESEANKNKKSTLTPRIFFVNAGGGRREEVL